MSFVGDILSRQVTLQEHNTLLDVEAQEQANVIDVDKEEKQVNVIEVDEEDEQQVNVVYDEKDEQQVNVVYEDEQVTETVIYEEQEHVTDNVGDSKEEMKISDRNTDDTSQYEPQSEVKNVLILQEEEDDDELKEHEVQKTEDRASSASLEKNHSFAKTATLYENERYQISSFSWSKNGLLPTDRKYISTQSGKHGWTSLDSADAAMITHGWVWVESSWNVVPAEKSSSSGGRSRSCTEYEYDYDGFHENVSLELPQQKEDQDPPPASRRHSAAGGPSTDAEGWIYATNFGNIEENGSPVKGMTHFVRRRLLARKQVFIGPSLVDGTCDHCDTEEVKRLSDCLLEAMTQASLYENPGDYSVVETNRLKNKLFELLGIASRVETFGDMKGVKGCIDKFLVAIMSAKSAWSKVSSLVGPDYLPEKLPERALEVSSRSFPQEERQEIAKMLIRKYDTNFEYHCHKFNCGSSCAFCVTHCPNLGCPDVLSAKYLSDHISRCPFTVLHCKRGCGDRIARKEVENHLLLDCVLRPAECPYACIGCRPDNMTVLGLTEHLSNPVHINAHLLLSLARLNEQQSVIIKLNKQICALESSVSDQGRAIALLQGGAAATMVAIKTTEKSLEEASRREIKDIEKKMNSKSDSTNKEIDSLRSSIKSLERENASQKTQLESLLRPRS